jgi:uncharacterized protein
MHPPFRDPVVHLELHTGNLARASDFYTRLFGWQAETVRAGGRTYLSVKLGDRIEGGIVERGLPVAAYVEVADLAEVIERAHALGAAVALEPREGPVGWRSILAVPSGARIALWQSKV